MIFYSIALNPTFVVASRDFERDLMMLKDLLNQLQNKTNIKDGYKLSEKGQMAAGWWFYEIFLKPEFVEKIIQTKGILDKEVKNEIDILEIIQVNLKQSGGGAKIRLYKDKPFLIRWWKWILK